MRTLRLHERVEKALTCSGANNRKPGGPIVRINVLQRMIKEIDDLLPNYMTYVVRKDFVPGLQKVLLAHHEEADMIHYGTVLCHAYGFADLLVDDWYDPLSEELTLSIRTYGQENYQQNQLDNGEARLEKMGQLDLL